MLGASWGDTAGLGRGSQGWGSLTGEAKSITHSCWDGTAGEGGWTSTESQAGNAALGGGHAKVEENQQKDGDAPPHLLQLHSAAKETLQAQEKKIETIIGV